MVLVSRGSRLGADGFMVWKSFIASGVRYFPSRYHKLLQYGRGSPSSRLGIGVLSFSFVSLGSHPLRIPRLLLRLWVVLVGVVIAGGMWVVCRGSGVLR